MEVLASPVDEGPRVAEAAADAGITLRLAGGVAVALRCPSARRPPLAREYRDIDMAGRAHERSKIAGFLQELGYQPDEEFNVLHGTRRLYFWDEVNSRQLDVFLDRVEMCHRIDLSDRIAIDERTLTLADLLLMKLQIVETNRKDMLDVISLLADHEFSDDDSAINLAYIKRLTSGDWGLWKTATVVAERVDHFARDLDAFERKPLLHDKIREFLEALETSEKTRAWKLRARIGERKRWYELPEGGF